MRHEAMLAIDECIGRYAKLQDMREDLLLAVEMLIEAYRTGHMLFIAGNGGSAADSEHIVGELMKCFTLKRKLSHKWEEKIGEMFPTDKDCFMTKLEMGLPAISLVSEVSFLSAFANDVEWELAFAQSVFNLGHRGDVFLAISTSGSSKNILYAAKIAKVKDMKVIALTGKTGGELKNLADVTLLAPAEETFQIQEFHLPIYHAMCIALEREFFLA